MALCHTLSSSSLCILIFGFYLKSHISYLKSLKTNYAKASPSSTSLGFFLGFCGWRRALRRLCVPYLEGIARRLRLVRIDRRRTSPSLVFLKSVCRVRRCSVQLPLRMLLRTQSRDLGFLVL